MPRGSISPPTKTRNSTTSWNAPGTRQRPHRHGPVLWPIASGIHHGNIPLRQHPGVLSLAAPPADRRSDSGVPGESNFAFLGYALNMRLTPTRRQLDYLRDLGASKESAKELKLLGLSDHLSTRYARLADDVYTQNVALLKRRLGASALFALLSTAAYYGAYAFVAFQTISGRLSVGTLVFLAGALGGASGQHPTDLLDLLEHRRPGAFPDGFFWTSSRLNPR